MTRQTQWKERMISSVANETFNPLVSRDAPCGQRLCPRGVHLLAAFRLAPIGITRPCEEAAPQPPHRDGDAVISSSIPYIFYYFHIFKIFKIMHIFQNHYWVLWYAMQCRKWNMNLYMTQNIKVCFWSPNRRISVLIPYISIIFLFSKALISCFDSAIIIVCNDMIHKFPSKIWTDIWAKILRYVCDLAIRP